MGIVSLYGPFETAQVEVEVEVRHPLIPRVEVSHLYTKYFGSIVNLWAPYSDQWALAKGGGFGRHYMHQFK